MFILSIFFNVYSDDFKFQFFYYNYQSKAHLFLLLTKNNYFCGQSAVGISRNQNVTYILIVSKKFGFNIIMEKQERQASQCIDPRQSGKPAQQRNRISQYCTQYQQFFEPENYPSCKEYLIAQLHSLNTIDSTSNHQQAYAKIKLINFTSNFQVIRLEVQLSSFIVEVVVLNVQGKSEVHNFENISDTCSPVFINEQSLNNTAVKCTPINNSSFIEIFFRVVKQYVIYKICSILHVGPALSNILGFDLIVYDDCIQFCMEKCIRVPPQTQMHRLELKKKLYMLHQLQIVHLDIKPANICWSPSLNEPVFIDFGCSEILSEEIGENTSTMYVGSFRYCSPELLKCYNNPKIMFMVDLYYNDVHSLSKTFADLSDQSEQTRIHFEKQPHTKIKSSSTTFQQTATWMQIKFKVFQSSFEIITDTHIQTFILDNLQKFLLFCRNVIYTEYIEHIYQVLKQRSKECSKVLDESYEKFNYNFNFNSENISHIRSDRNNRYYIPMIEGFTFQRNSGRSEEHHLVDPDNIRELLLNKLIIESVDRENYYKSFIYFVNLQNTASKFPEKIEVCRIFCQASGLEGNTSDEQKMLARCFVYLMSYYLQSEREGCLDVIPILLGNIVILQAVSQEQLLQYYQSIGSLKLRDSKVKAFLVYRSELCLQWIGLIIDPKYEICQIVKIIRELHSNLLLKLSQNMDDKNHKILKLFYDTYKYGCNKYKLGIIKQLEFGRENTFTGSVMKRELGLYYYMNIYQYHIYRNNFKEAGRHVKIITNILQHINNAKNFLHFMIRVNFIMLYWKTKNYKMITELFLSFEKCLDSPKILQKFRLSAYNSFLDYLFQKCKSTAIYFANILNIIKAQPTKTDIQILQYVSFIYTTDTHNQSLLNGCRKEVEEIYGFLRQKFPISLLGKFPEFYTKYKSNFSSFFRISHNLVCVLNQIYKYHPDIYSLTMSFKSNLIELKKQIPCKECQYLALRNIISIQANAMFKRSDIQGILNIYFDYIDSGNCRQNDKLFYLIEIIRYSLMRPAFFNVIEPIISKFYETVRRNGLWGFIFTLPRPQLAIEIIHKYLLLNQKLSEFFEIHIKLAQNIKYNPSKEYTFCYSKCLLQFVISLKEEENAGLNSQFLENFKNYPLENYSTDFHTTIFCSMLLPCLPYQEYFIKFRTKITLFICKHIHRLLPFFKSLVLGHLLFSLIVFQVIKVNETSKKFLTPSSRVMKYYYKSYLKYSISQQNFIGFVNAVSDLSILRKELHNNKQTNCLINHLRGYFKNLQMMSLGFDLIVKYYNSPVKNFKQRLDY